MATFLGSAIALRDGPVHGVDQVVVHVLPHWRLPALRNSLP